MTHIRRRRTCIATRKRVIAYPTIISGTYPSLLFLITQRALVILSDALASRPGAAPSDALRAERRICFLRFSTTSCVPSPQSVSIQYASAARNARSSFLRWPQEQLWLRERAAVADAKSRARSPPRAGR